MYIASVHAHTAQNMSSLTKPVPVMLKPTVLLFNRLGVL